MNAYVTWLESRGATTARLGGKGASLARLGAAGFPVPPGFGVTVDAYRAFHDAHALDEVLVALFALEERPTAAQVREACAPVMRRLADSSLPDPVREAVGQAFDELDSRTRPRATYAVRSSGVSEDGAGASFAGLYESYLNLGTREAVLDALQRCYHCLWEPRAAHYRAIKKFDHRKEAMGVVVMETVPSAISGVAFTLNPVTGSTDEILINSSWGLGESIVSGMVTPDNFLMGKDGSLRHADISPKETQVVTTEGGTMSQPVPPDLVRASSLTDDRLRQVTETAMAVEQHYGCPMDIEFAYDGAGNFYLLQARPITTH